MLDDAFVLMLWQKAEVQVTGNLAGKLLIVNEDKNPRLSSHGKGNCQKALIVTEILNIIDSFMCSIYGVWAV